MAKIGKLVDMYVNREAIHSSDKNKHRDYERVFPNPDPNDKGPMMLKRPSKKPKYLVVKHHKKMNMTKDLINRYSKTIKKGCNPGLSPITYFTFIYIQIDYNTLQK